jgi:hypothetical protein
VSIDTLKTGDPVLVWMYGMWTECRVEVPPRNDRGKLRGSFRRHPSIDPATFRRWPNFWCEVRRVGDPVTANVFADFLEENGEARAAALLRSAFPLADGKDGGA